MISLSLLSYYLHFEAATLTTSIEVFGEAFFKKLQKRQHDYIYLPPHLFLPCRITNPKIIKNARNMKLLLTLRLALIAPL